MNMREQSDSWNARVQVRSRPWIAVAGVVILLVGAIGIAWLLNGPVSGGETFTLTEASAKEPAETSPDQIPEDQPAPSKGEDLNAGAPEPATICIHVAGEVKEPGVVYLIEGARVNDAIQAAGGFTKKADQTSVNLAAALTDAQQVVVAAKASSTSASPAAAQNAPASGASAPSAAASSGPININTASASELTALNGIGEATAAKIVADRETNGPFASIEDIKRVSGIGDKKFEALRDAICV